MPSLSLKNLLTELEADPNSFIDRRVLIKKIHLIMEQRKQKKTMSYGFRLIDFKERAHDLEVEQQTDASGHIKLYDRSKFSEAFREMIARYDASMGITWETIDFYLNHYCRLP